MNTYTWGPGFGDIDSPSLTFHSPEADLRGDQTLRNTSRSSFPALPNVKNHLRTLSEYRLLGLPLTYPFRTHEDSPETSTVSALPGVLGSPAKEQGGGEAKSGGESAGRAERTITKRRGPHKVRCLERRKERKSMDLATRLSWTN